MLTQKACQSVSELSRRFHGCLTLHVCVYLEVERGHRTLVMGFADSSHASSPRVIVGFVKLALKSSP